MKKCNSMKSLEKENSIVYNDNKNLLPNGYAEWQKGIEQLIEISKLRTAISVNADTLTLYWKIGRSILQKQKEALYILTKLIKFQEKVKIVQ